MIKVIAFDLVGVLVTEKDIKLKAEEEKLERLFGPNIDDASYIMQARNVIKNDSQIINKTEEIINKLYKVKDEELLKKIKEKYKNIKIVIATNHVSFVKKYIRKTFNQDYLDDIIVSAEIHKVKPNIDFYNLLLDKYQIKPNELLFLDDNQTNINAAQTIKIKTIKVHKETNIFKEICDILDN